MVIILRIRAQEDFLHLHDNRGDAASSASEHTK